MMKKVPSLLVLLALAACNNATTEQQALAEEPISLNEIAKPLADSRDNSEKPMKKDKNMSKKQTHEIAITVPDGTWGMSVKEVLETDTEIAVIVKLSKAEGMMGIQVISELVTAIEFESEKPAKIYVIGKTWGWENTEAYEFIDIENAPIGRPLAYEKIEPSHKSGPKKQIVGESL